MAGGEGAGVQRRADSRDCVEVAHVICETGESGDRAEGRDREIREEIRIKRLTPSKSPPGVRHGLDPWWTTLREFIIFSIQYISYSKVCSIQV